MSSVPFPQDDPDAWDTVELGGIALPGICRVSVRRSNELDVKKPKGKDGSSITFQGKNPAKVVIFCSVSTAQEFRDLRAALDLIQPQADGPGGVPISHPKCTFWRIPSVFIEDFEDTDNQKGDEVTVKISAVEFRPKEAKKSGFVTKTPTGLDPREQNLAEDIGNNPPAAKPSAGNTAP